MSFADIATAEPEQLLHILPRQVAEWRDELTAKGLAKNSVRRKLTVLRSVFSFLQAYGYSGVNPAHGDFVNVPSPPRDGKTVGLAPEDCRRMLDAPAGDTPEAIRDRALLAVLAFTGCRVGELCRLRVGDFKASSGHRLLEVQGKGGKDRRVPLHPEAVERLEEWLDLANLRKDLAGPLFRPARTARGNARKGFLPRPITRRAVQYLVRRMSSGCGSTPPSPSIRSGSRP